MESFSRAETKSHLSLLPLDNKHHFSVSSLSSSAKAGATCCVSQGYKED